MSKKLIAVASAAALALSALVALPVAALTVKTDDNSGVSNVLVTGTVDRGAGTTGTIGNPYLVPVPDSGVATSSTMVRFVISSDVKSRAFTVTSTSGIKLLDAVNDATNKYTAASGAASLALTTNASGAAEFWAFPTTTTKGAITITLDGDITQIYVTGTAGTAWDLTTVVFPALEEKKAGVVTAVVTDGFGNPVTGATLTGTVVGAGITPAAVTLAYSTTTKRFEGTIPAGTTTGQVAIALDLVATASTTRTTAFGAANNTAFGLVNVVTAKSVATLTADVAALQAQLAITVTKARYNKLVKRWNKANPRNKVKLAK
jgi:hypothetical protein